MTPADEPARLREFLALSVELTGFSSFDLVATGMAGAYLDVLDQDAGTACVDELLGLSRAIRESGSPGANLERAIRDELLSVPRFGAVLRNLIKLWYLGQWYSLPEAPQAQPSSQRRLYQGRLMRPGAATAMLADTQTRVISPQAYLQGLAWKAMKAHPMGGKQQGYAMWGEPPPGSGGGDGDA